MPDHHSDRQLAAQLNDYFIERLCRLNSNQSFWTDLPDQGGDPELFRRLTKYYHVLRDRHHR